MDAIRLNLLLALTLAGCTFPVKNDVGGDTAAVVSELDDIPTSNIPNCDGDQLLFGIELRDSGGDLVSSVPAGSRTDLWATIGNPCDTTIDYQTDTQCLVESWSIDGGGFDPAIYSFLCSPEPEARTLQSGKQIRRLVSPVNDLSAGVYTIGISFSFSTSDAGSKVTESISLQVTDG